MLPLPGIVQTLSLTQNTQQEKKLTQIFIFTLLCGASKGCVEVLKSFIKPFQAPQRCVTRKTIFILIDFSEIHRTGRVNKNLRKSDWFILTKDSKNGMYKHYMVRKLTNEQSICNDPDKSMDPNNKIIPDNTPTKIALTYLNETKRPQGQTVSK